MTHSRSAPVLLRVGVARAALMLTTALLLAAGCGAPDGRGVPEFGVEPGQVVASAPGASTVSVWTAPAPPAKGVNAVRLRIVDAGGEPVEGGALRATAWMPAHGHGASVVPSVTEVGGGVYDLSRVVFFMEGRWELRGELMGVGGAPDGFLATFDVQ